MAANEGTYALPDRQAATVSGGESELQTAQQIITRKRRFAFFKKKRRNSKLTNKLKV